MASAMRSHRREGPTQQLQGLSLNETSFGKGWIVSEGLHHIKVPLKQK